MSIVIEFHKLPANPLYVHPSDNIGTPQVTNIFNVKNFDNGKRFVITASEAKHKVAFITDKCAQSYLSSILLPLWQRNNPALVLAS